MRLSSLGLVLALGACASVLHAQQPEPQPLPPAPPPAAAPHPYQPYGAPPSPYGQPPYGQPPSPYGQPPSPYGQPPTVYQVPPGYPPPAGAEPVAAAPPASALEGDIPPPGYHFEERPRDGLVTAGYLLTLIPWGIGLLGASAASFRNESTWLGIPVLGPWMTIGRRDYVCGRGDRGAGDAMECVGEVFLVGAYIFDGILQASGVTLLMVGYMVPKKVMVRDDQQAVRITPMRVGSGYGAGVIGAF